MKRLSTRVTELEQQRRRSTAPRCSTCRTWPDFRVVVLNDPTEPATPESCTTCGWAPLSIEITIADDWNAVRA